LTLKRGQAVKKRRGGSEWTKTRTPQGGCPHTAVWVSPRRRCGTGGGVTAGPVDHILSVGRGCVGGGVGGVGPALRATGIRGVGGGVPSSLWSTAGLRRVGSPSGWVGCILTEVRRATARGAAGDVPGWAECDRAGVGAECDDTVSRWSGAYAILAAGAYLEGQLGLCRPSCSAHPKGAWSVSVGETGGRGKRCGVCLGWRCGVTRRVVRVNRWQGRRPWEARNRIIRSVCYRAKGGRTNLPPAFIPPGQLSRRARGAIATGPVPPSLGNPN